MDRSNIRKLANYLAIYRCDIIVVMIAITFISASLLALGNTIRQLVDYGLTAKYTASINHSMITICCCIVVFGASSFLRSYFINNLAEKVTNLIRNDILKNLMQRDIAYFEDYKTANILSLLVTDMEVIAKLIIDTLSFAVRNSLMLVGSLTFMFIHSYKLSMIVLGLVPLLMLPLVKLGRHVRQLSKKSLELQDGIASNILENFTYIQTLYAFNQQQRKINEYVAQTDGYLHCVSHRLKMRAMFFAITISMILIAITAVIWIGSNDIVTGKISSGQMVSFIYYSIVVGMSAGGIVEFIGEAQKPLATLDRIFENVQHMPITQARHTEFISGSNEIPKQAQNDGDGLKVEREIVAKQPINPPSIKFDNISFIYPTRTSITVLKSVSFDIKYGQFIGIVGRSGSGKSTIMQLLLKFYSPTSGKIIMSDHDVATINDHDIRNLIAYVPQEPSIFSGTIKSNIAFANPDASDEEITEAAIISGALDFINLLPDGINTIIGERGVKLSGGQKQRIAISRAILHQPQILLLDEATSALDSESEQALFRALHNSMKGKTIISIAHRISTIEDADEIFLIDKGVLNARGTHNQLLTNSNIYRILCEEQMISL